MSKEPIQIFEYDSLHIDEKILPQRSFDALVKFNDRCGNKFFTVGHKKITFKNYVGLLQVGKLTIEVLPKADRRAESRDSEKWKSALIQMLAMCRLIKLESLTNADIKLKNRTLFDLYINMFLTELESIIRQGLVKKYHQIQENVAFCKGKIVFSEHIKQNLVHKERFYNEFDNYDYDNIYNQILLTALDILRSFPNSHKFNHRIKRISLMFPEVKLRNIEASDFERINYDRNTERYKSALQLARLIILDYTPDIAAGRENVLAILFDMNKLFEEFVYRLLVRSCEPGWEVKRQCQKDFWRYDSRAKVVKPDIVVYKDHCRSLVIDTKWKIPDDALPSDADLKQMYVYHQYFSVNKTMLLYPEVPRLLSGIFVDTPFECSVKQLSLEFKENKLDIEKMKGKVRELVKHESN
ncbi:MAG: restriction endonuclease [Candidatus Wallbacteria bacterium]|nr:restriction endonuclease [Candidatus Wallbacteria bacterium]